MCGVLFAQQLKNCYRFIVEQKPISSHLIINSKNGRGEIERKKSMSKTFKEATSQGLKGRNRNCFQPWCPGYDKITAHTNALWSNGMTPDFERFRDIFDPQVKLIILNRNLKLSGNFGSIPSRAINS